LTQFTALDWLWTIAYLLLMVGGPLFFYKLARRSESDFFLAGRGLPWWLPASSVFSTHTATDTPMWVTGVVYAHGLRGLWYTFFAAWTSVGAFVSARMFRRSLAYTQAEWQVVRFGGLGAELLRGWLAGWQVFMNMFILGWVGMAMGKVCALAFGWPEWVGLVIPSTITAVYTLAAGFWGVIIGDFLQGIVAIWAVVFVSIVGVVAAGGATEITARLVSMGQEWRLDPFAFTGWWSGEFPAAWWLTMLVIAVLGGFGMGTSIDWYVEAQRIQSSRSLRDACYGIWAGGAITLVRNAFWAAAIVAFFVMLPNLTSVAEYELGWFRQGFELLPAGLVGVFFGAILAIHFSTISSHLNLGALYFTRDLYQRYLNPRASERRLVWVGRLATLVLLVGSFFYGLMMEEITQWLIFALWLMMAGVWLPNILQVVWWRFNASGYLASWMANLGLSWLVVWILPSFGVIPSLPDYLQFWLLMALGALVFLPATLLTRAEDMDHLVRYYVMVRPIGWWGPVRREALRRGLVGEDSTPSAAAPPDAAGELESSRAPAPNARRPLIRRTWTPEAAGGWTREDWIAVFVSPLVFAGILIGLTKLLLLQMSGLWITLATAGGAVFLYWVIDPKLRAVSVEYEARQAVYLADLEKQHRWEQAGIPSPQPKAAPRPRGG
jgi:Na+/proline symporter